MDLIYYESFIETANQKSMAKASEKLNLTQPALGKQIKKLESYYGVQLVKRSSTGIELTEPGRRLYERIRPVLQEMDSIRNEMHHFAGLKKLNLGTLPSIAAHYLPQRIYRLEQKQVVVDLSFRNTSNEIYELLKEGRLDGCVIERLPFHASFWSSDLFTEPYYVVVPERHPLSEEESVSLSQIACEPLILYPPECSIRKKVVSLMDDLQVRPSIKMEVPFGDFIVGYVAAGAGITVVPELIAAHVQSTSVRTIPLRDPGARRTISLVSPTEATGKFLLPYLKSDR